MSEEIIITPTLSGDIVIGVGQGGAVGPAGPTGPQGPTGATGPGVPTGGTTNQVLAKINSTDYNTQWIDVPSSANTVVKNPTASQIITSSTTAVPLALSSTGAAHALTTTLGANSGEDKVALDVVSNNELSSAMWLTGRERAHGTLKIGHIQPVVESDAGAGAISINLKSDEYRGSAGDETAVQGFFLDTYQGNGTTSGLTRTKVGSAANGETKLTLTLSAYAADPVTKAANEIYGAYTDVNGYSFLGWTVAGTGIDTDTRIVSISSNGLELTLSKPVIADIVNETITFTGGYPRYGTTGNLVNLNNARVSRMVLNADGQLKLPVVSTAGGLVLGGDTTLYRAAADHLKTDDNFTVQSSLYVGSTNYSPGNMDWSAPSGSNATYQLVTDVYRTSSPSTKIVPTSSSLAYVRAGGATTFPATVGSSYTASAYFKTSSGTQLVRINIHWYSSTNSYLGVSSGSNFTANDSTWTKATLTATAPTSAAYGYVLLILMDPTTAGNYAYVDDVLVVESNAALYRTSYNTLKTDNNFVATSVTATIDGGSA